MGFGTYYENSHTSEVEKGKDERNRTQKRNWEKLADLSRNDKSNMYHGRQIEKSEMHWEQKYCLMNGIRWKKLLDTKKYLHQYSDITGWDDSAGKEDFDNAKSRYWAQINGLQPDISLPDADMLTVTVDDHEAPLSIQKLYEILHGSISEDKADVDDCSDLWGDGSVVLWDLHYTKKEEEVVWVNILAEPGDSHPIKPTGWGDNDPLNHTAYEGIIPTGWDKEG